MKVTLRGKPQSRQGWVLALIVIAIIVAGYLSVRSTNESDDASAAPAATDDGVSTIAEAFRDRRSDVWVEAEGVVERILPDDDEGSRHQRFILRLAPGHTLLISHNIDLARRVPIERGDTLRFRGEYEWNDRGGVVHWTHHDPAGRHPGGWLSHRGTVYR